MERVGDAQWSAEQLSRLALQSLGPKGRHVLAMVGKSGDDFRLSSISNRIFEVVCPEDSVSQLLVQSTVTVQHAAHGDGGLFSLFVAASLIAAVARDSRGSVAKRLLMVQGIQMALQWCLERITGNKLASTCACPLCPKPHSLPSPPPSHTLNAHTSSSSSTSATAALTGHACCKEVSRGSHVAQSANPLPPPLSQPLSVADLASMLALVRSVVSPKKVAAPRASDSEHLVTLLVRAFVSSLPSPVDDDDDDEDNEGDHASDQDGVGEIDGTHRRGHGWELGPCVRTVEYPGRFVGDSFCLDGVLLDTPLPAHAPILLPVSNVRLALFDVNLDLDLCLSSDAPRLRMEVVARQGGEGAPHSGEWDNYDVPGGNAGLEEGEGPAPGVAKWVGSSVSGRARRRVLEGVADWAVRQKVGVLASQKVIHPYLQDRLAFLGILAIERLSIRHVAAVARISGALALSGGCPLDKWTAALGHISRASLTAIGNATYIHIQGGTAGKMQRMGGGGGGGGSCHFPARPGSPVSTLVLCAWNEEAARELSAVASSAISVLSASLRTPMVVEGGGRFEGELARHVWEQADAALPSQMERISSANSSVGNRDKIQRLCSSSGSVPGTGTVAKSVCEEEGGRKGGAREDNEGRTISSSAPRHWSHQRSTFMALHQGALALSQSLSLVAATLSETRPNLASDVLQRGKEERQRDNECMSCSLDVGTLSKMEQEGDFGQHGRPSSTCMEGPQNAQRGKCGRNCVGCQSNSILDLASVKVSALKSAVDAACLILRTNLIT